MTNTVQETDENQALGSWKYLMFSMRHSLLRLLFCICSLGLAIFAVSFWSIPSKERWITFSFQAVSSIVGGCIIGLSSKIIEPALLAATARDGFNLSDLNYTLGWSGGLIGCVGFLSNPLARQNKFWRWGFISAFLMLASGTFTALIFTEGPNENLVNCLVSNRTEETARDITGATLSRISDGALGVLVTTWSPGEEANFVKTRAFQSNFMEVNNQVVRATAYGCTRIENGIVSNGKVNQYNITTLDSDYGVVMWPTDMLGIFFTSNSGRRLGVHINSPDWPDGTNISWICQYGAETEKQVPVDCKLKVFTKVCTTLDYINGVGFNYNWDVKNFPSHWLLGGYRTSPVIQQLTSTGNVYRLVRAVVWAHLEAAYADAKSVATGTCTLTTNYVQIRWGVTAVSFASLILALIGMIITCKLACESSPKSWMDVRVGAIFKNGMDAQVNANSVCSYEDMLGGKGSSQPSLNFHFLSDRNHVGLTNTPP